MAIAAGSTANRLVSCGTHRGCVWYGHTLAASIEDRDPEETSVIVEGRRRWDQLTLTLRLPSGGFATIQDELMVVGSAEQADLRLEDSSVSRVHAELVRTGRGVWVRDLESTNGTFLNGVRVKHALLEPEQTLTLGKADVRVLQESAQTGDAPWPTDRFGALRGDSEVMLKLFARLDLAAQSDGTVLLEGETGTGKELAARAIHDASTRASGPFVVVDCGALAQQVLESELFGHVRGAYTGAQTDRVGALELANGGTVFLDEVGELPLSLQPKLLRALAARTIRRVGDSQERPIDVRFVAATHRELRRMVGTGGFREDLYFRLAVLLVRLPPLRDRLDDIPLLVRVFLQQLPQTDPLDASLVHDWQRRAWPGNIRELRNAVERTVIFGVSDADLPELESAAEFPPGHSQSTLPSDSRRVGRLS